jgi:hypothetical protein
MALLWTVISFAFSLLLTPFLMLLLAIIFLASIGKSLGVRRLYIKLLLALFEVSLLVARGEFPFSQSQTSQTKSTGALPDDHFLRTNATSVVSFDRSSPRLSPEGRPFSTYIGAFFWHVRVAATQIG